MQPINEMQGRPSPPAAQNYDQFGDKPFGPVAAAFIAAGIGAFVLGLMTTLAEASTSYADKLNWYNPVGPLSGKTLIAVMAWVVSWIILYPLGLLLTFPIFFDLFAKD